MHPTIKPVELIRRPIRWHTRPGELLYEPFSGSGTCLIAAEQTRPQMLRPRALAGLRRRRRDQRWQRFTGKEATLEGDGRSFAELAADAAEPAAESR